MLNFLRIQKCRLSLCICEVYPGLALFLLLDRKLGCVDWDCVKKILTSLHCFISSLSLT